ncbi:MAG: cytochrome C oxidase subunit IV family protein [Pirellulales bacterium]
MTDPHHSAAHGDAHHEHHTSLGLYVYVFVALCVLTGASFFTYSDKWPFHHPDQEWVGWTFMMAVSCTKAMLVIMFFMHVKYEKSWKYVLTIPTAMMATFLVLMLVPDVGMRTHHYSEERMQNAARNPHADDDAEHDGDHNAGEHGHRH